MSESPEVTRALNFLASMPLHGHTTVERPALKEIMLQTGGTMMACGQRWEIVKKYLGAGVYRLSLKAQA